MRSMRIPGKFYLIVSDLPMNNNKPTDCARLRNLWVNLLSISDFLHTIQSVSLPRHQEESVYLL